jgi:hypothetical protein
LLSLFPLVVLRDFLEDSAAFETLLQLFEGFVEVWGGLVVSFVGL